MGYRLTPEERRIIERAKREGEELYASQTPAEKKKEIRRSMLIWVGGLILFALLGVLIAYVGSLF